MYRTYELIFMGLGVIMGIDLMLLGKMCLALRRDHLRRKLESTGMENAYLVRPEKKRKRLASMQRNAKLFLLAMKMLLNNVAEIFWEGMQSRAKNKLERIQKKREGIIARAEALE